MPRRIVPPWVPAPLRRKLGAVRVWVQRLTAGAEFVPLPALLVRQTLAPRRRLLSHPWRLKNLYVAARIAAVNRYKVQHNPRRPYDVALHTLAGKPSALPDGPGAPPVLNRRCSSISKEHVARVFEEVFGYRLTVDPMTYRGEMVEKSNGNATHDGQILQGPLAPDELQPGRVYQRLVDNVEQGAEGPVAVDLRTPLYGGHIPLVYLKRRSTSERFHNQNARVEILDAREVFSPVELDQLAALARAMNLDYGEADVLRDVGDGRIYVVDVANTPSGPPKGLTPGGRKTAVERLAAAFDTLVEDALGGPDLVTEVGVSSESDVGARAAG